MVLFSILVFFLFACLFLPGCLEQLQPKTLPHIILEKYRIVWVRRNLSRLSSPTHKVYEGLKRYMVFNFSDHKMGLCKQKCAYITFFDQLIPA